MLNSPFDRPNADDPGPRFIAAHRYVDAARQFPVLYEVGPARVAEDGRDARPPFAERLVMFFRMNGEALTFWFGMTSVGVLLATVVGAYLGGMRL